MSDPVSARVHELYEQHAPLVLAICRGLLRDPVEAEDAAQQTFLSAQRALANGSVPREPVPWLATIARNECLGRMRARAAGPVPTADGAEAAAPDTHADAVRREQVAELRDALAELPAQQREAILLREVRGLSYDEVAASLAVTTSAVESLIFRARRRLQLRLREAVTAVSPVGWLMPLRELALRFGGSGLASPDVAKVVAVGVGAAAVAGVTVTPQLLRSERPAPAPPPAHARPSRSASPPAASAPTVAAPPAPPARPQVQVAPAVWTTTPRHVAAPPRRERERERTDTAEVAVTRPVAGTASERESDHAEHAATTLALASTTPRSSSETETRTRPSVPARRGERGGGGDSHSGTDAGTSGDARGDD